MLALFCRNKTFLPFVLLAPQVDDEKGLGIGGSIETLSTNNHSVTQQAAGGESIVVPGTGHPSTIVFTFKAIGVYHSRNTLQLQSKGGVQCTMLPRIGKRMRVREPLVLCGNEGLGYTVLDATDPTSYPQQHKHKKQMGSIEASAQGERALELAVLSAARTVKNATTYYPRLLLRAVQADERRMAKPHLGDCAEQQACVCISKLSRSSSPVMAMARTPALIVQARHKHIEREDCISGYSRIEKEHDASWSLLIDTLGGDVNDAGPSCCSKHPV